MTADRSHPVPDPGPFVSTGGLFWIIVVVLVFVLVLLFVWALCACAKYADQDVAASSVEEEMSVSYSLYPPTGGVDNVTFRRAPARRREADHR